MTSRQNEYFIPGDGISREVIQADICRYLGNDALVRPGNHNGRSGFFIRAYRNLTTEMISDLKDDSARWEAERRGDLASQGSYPHRNYSQNEPPISSSFPYTVSSATYTSSIGPSSISNNSQQGPSPPPSTRSMPTYPTPQSSHAPTQVLYNEHHSPYTSNPSYHGPIQTGTYKYIPSEYDHKYTPRFPAEMPGYHPSSVAQPPTEYYTPTSGPWIPADHQRSLEPNRRQPSPGSNRDWH